MFAFLSKNFKNHKLLVLGILISAHLGIFYKFYLYGLLPFPGDLLVSFFFPWNSGGFTGADPWVTHKEVIASDVIRQIFPWKTFAFDQIHNLQFPLWNPYNFSGYPLIANLQSSVFFPGNVVYLFLPTLWGWISQVLFLPLLMSVFMYLFLRSCKLSRLASAFGAVVSANLGYIMVWHEQLIITQVALFLPLVLWLANLYDQKRKPIFLLLISLFLACAIFGGHAQTFIYLLTVSVTYMLVKHIPLLKIIPTIGFALLLASVQLFPTMEIYFHSAREGEATRQLFSPFILPWESLLTILSPDFFGNPATGNFWGKQYGDFQVYFGVVATVFALLAVIKFHTEKIVRLFIFLSIIGILFATYPLVYIPHILNIPILATGVPARIIYIFQFSAAVLAAFGFESVIRKEKFRILSLWPTVILILAAVSMWLFALFGNNPNASIIKSNLILPTGVLFLTLVTILGFGKIKHKYSSVLLFIFFALAIFEYSYLFNKYQPFAPEKYVFPTHRVFNFLQQKAGVDRFFGFGTAYVDSNFATQYKVYAPEGWDSLYIKRYGELLASAEDGKFPRQIKRSDANFPAANNRHRNRLFDILGVKYILDKDDNPQSNWEPDIGKFPSEKYQLVWQSNKWKAYSRLTALPRAFLADGYEVIKDDHQVLARLYSSDFDYRHKLIIDQDLKLKPTAGKVSEAKIISYKPNEVIVQTNSDTPRLLFLSDAYFPGWQAAVDQKSAPLYQANYILRAVPVEPGSHEVVFSYDPQFFYAGLYLSLSSFVLLGLLAIYLLKRNDKN